MTRIRYTGVVGSLVGEQAFITTSLIERVDGEDVAKMPDGKNRLDFEKDVFLSIDAFRGDSLEVDLEVSFCMVWDSKHGRYKAVAATPVENLATASAGAQLVTAAGGQTGFLPTLAGDPSSFLIPGPHASLLDSEFGDVREDVAAEAKRLGIEGDMTLAIRGEGLQGPNVAGILEVLFRARIQKLGEDGYRDDADTKAQRLKSLLYFRELMEWLGKNADPTIDLSDTFRYFIKLVKGTLLTGRDVVSEAIRQVVRFTTESNLLGPNVIIAPSEQPEKLARLFVTMPCLYGHDLTPGDSKPANWESVLKHLPTRLVNLLLAYNCEPQRTPSIDRFQGSAFSPQAQDILRKLKQSTGTAFQHVLLLKSGEDNTPHMLLGINHAVPFLTFLGGSAELREENFPTEAKVQDARTHILSREREITLTLQNRAERGVCTWYKARKKERLSLADINVPGTFFNEMKRRGSADLFISWLVEEEE